MQFKHLLAAGALAMASLLTSQAEVIVFWDFNDDDVVPTAGSAVAEAWWDGVGVGSIAYLPGTTLNANPEVPAGQSFGFFDAANVVSSGTFQATQISFENQQGVTLSFAVRTDHLFEFSESVKVYYNSGAGWNFKSEVVPLPNGDWSIFQVSVPELDNLSSGGIRIVTDTTLDVGKYVSFDNLTLSAVPEPSTFVLLAPLAALAWHARQRRK